MSLSEPVNKPAVFQSGATENKNNAVFAVPPFSTTRTILPLRANKFSKTRISAASSTQTAFASNAPTASTASFFFELPESYERLLTSTNIKSSALASPQVQDAAHDLVATTPLFSWSVKSSFASQNTSPIKQYGLLCHEPNQTPTDPIFLNTNAPWSAFICGSQGAGKSHTLSCMLECCLMSTPQLGKLHRAPAGVLFTYDVHNTDQPCEAAYLSSEIPVTVLVSPSNFWSRERIYQKLNPKIKVRPFLFKDHHINIERMSRLMAFKDLDGSLPLYMASIFRLLRQMAIEAKGNCTFDYKDFTRRLRDENTFTKDQNTPLRMRLDVLESFMASNYAYKSEFGLRNRADQEDPFELKPGELTIVDLSDPLVDRSTACSLFDMCLAIYFETSSSISKVVALDEAHKFLSGDASDNFSASLIQLIREQRHKAARVIISTQEPSISPALLDLCSMTFLHRFGSPAWLDVLRKHVAGASHPDLLHQISTLKTGESIVFAPTACLHVVDGRVVPLGTDTARVMTRKRLTDDGGKSIMATKLS